MLREWPDDWHHFSAWDNWDKSRHVIDVPGMVFYPGFELLFPTIASVIKQLPFEQLGVVGLAKQRGVIYNHVDGVDDENPYEPARYMDLSHRSFEKYVLPRIQWHEIFS
jgi:hypothetical protein